jgi:hypothetical protein
VSIPRLQQATLDPRILSFTLAITLFCGIVFGLAPSFSSPGNKLKHVLTTAQVAISLTLLSIAGLLVASLSKLQNVNAGIGVDHVLTADITVGPAHYPNAQSRQEFFENLASRLRPMPGVEAVAIADTVPPSGFVHSKPLGAVQVVGRPARDRAPGGIVAWRRVSPEYFAALGVPMLQAGISGQRSLPAKPPP